MEPRFNEVAGDRPNLFVKWRVRYIEVLFHTFYCNFGRDIEIISFVISRTSLNRGSLNRGSTVLHLFKGVVKDTTEKLMHPAHRKKGIYFYLILMANKHRTRREALQDNFLFGVQKSPPY